MTALAAERSVSLARQPVAALVIVAGVVFAASMFGILTRPLGFLAAFWPANAILLGMMVRWPRLATLPNWAAAFAAYIAADLVTGGSFFITLWLTVANIVGAITGFLLFSRLSERDRRLKRPQSVLFLLLILVVSSLAAAVAGGGAARFLFDRGLIDGIEFWFTTELVNSLVILPAILAFPGITRLSRDGGSAARLFAMPLYRLAPVAALALSAVAATAMGGPGAMAFPVPALVWCALSYAVFPTAILTMLLCGWLLVAASAGLIALPMSDDLVSSTNSLRLGVALMAIGPLSVSSINAAREDLMARLMHAANHDALTGILSRRAFMDRSQRMVARHSVERAACALLLLDIDHFKRVNDTHGHAVGDDVLVAFTRLASSLVRPGDILARIGGEEFAVLLPDTGLDGAIEVAERIRATVGNHAITVSSGMTITISASIGVAVTCGGADPSLDRLMASADKALYDAKAAGRNIVQAAA